MYFLSCMLREFFESSFLSPNGVCCYAFPQCSTLPFLRLRHQVCGIARPIPLGPSRNERLSRMYANKFLTFHRLVSVLKIRKPTISFSTDRVTASHSLLIFRNIPDRNRSVSSEQVNLIKCKLRFIRS